MMNPGPSKENVETVHSEFKNTELGFSNELIYLHMILSGMILRNIKNSVTDHIHFTTGHMMTKDEINMK